MSDYEHICRQRLATRRGRGLRGVLFLSEATGTHSRKKRFEQLITYVVRDLSHFSSSITKVEFGCEDVPPSDPAPWEDGIVLGRAFPADKAAGLPIRVVLYRLAITGRCRDEQEIACTIRRVIVENLATLWNKAPEEIDPFYEQ